MPVDRILFTAAAPELPTTLVDQLAPGGVMIGPVGDIGRPQMLVRVTRAPVTVRVATDPTFYFVVPRNLNALSIKMTGQDIPGTVKAIEATLPE